MAMVQVSAFPSLRPDTDGQGHHYTMARNLENFISRSDSSVNAARAKLQNPETERYLGRFVDRVV